MLTQEKKFTFCRFSLLDDGMCLRPTSERDGGDGDLYCSDHKLRRVWPGEES